ncbi:phage tail protein [Cohnella zeiphila]|uniref:Phage tail protein n=1 Tax=Cohnella zeiphila TaxID=2761120 RepID=A0A7X0SPM4_9BACL|nr:tail fiber protein [Cohnella zeiphila]MBB6733850.1 phage tail protein [Cohnella zeiphila]
MAEPFLGEIRLFPLGFAPRGWVYCEGQTLQISSNQALYALLGTTYGGDGVRTFMLPDLRGKVPIHMDAQYPLGRSAGESAHTLTESEMPKHVHQVQASSVSATSVVPAGNVWAQVEAPYTSASSLTAMNPKAIGTAGSGQAHNNMQPYLAVRFCIALQGIFPSRN